MGLRAASSESTSSNARSTSDDGGSSRIERIVRLALVGVALVVLADRVARYLESIGPAVDDARKQRGRATPRGQTQIEIGGPDETDETDGTDGTDAATDTDAGNGDDAEPIDDDKTNAELTAEERSPEEIDERTEPDAGNEPAPPGEMTINEDVADEVREDDDEDEE